MLGGCALTPHTHTKSDIAHSPSSATLDGHKIRLRLGRMVSIKKYRQCLCRRRDAGIFLKFIHTYDYEWFVWVCCLLHSSIRSIAQERQNKAPNIHINVKYGRFNDTFSAPTCTVFICGVHWGPTECLTLSCTYTQALTAYHYVRVTNTTIDELELCAEMKQDNTHSHTCSGIYV